MEPYENQLPKLGDMPGDAGLMNDMVSVLTDAKFGLTEDDILAVIAIRQYRTVVSALEDLILMGKIGAERRDVHESTPVTIRSFVFYCLSDDEQGKLHTAKEQEIGDEFAF